MNMVIIFFMKKLDYESSDSSDFPRSLEHSFNCRKENSDWLEWTQELYTDFESLINCVMLWAKNVGIQSLSILRSDLCKDNVNLKYSRAEFGCKKCLSRGNTNMLGCGLLIGIRLKEKENLLRVVKFNFKNASVHCMRMDSSNIVLTSEHELTVDEKQKIIECGPDKPSIPILKLSLQRLFGNDRVYHSQLLHRLLKIGETKFLGTDKDSMVQFFDYCNQIKQKGGFFNHGVCNVTLKLTHFILQTTV